MNIRNIAAALTLGLGTLGMATVSQAAILEFDINAAQPLEGVEVVQRYLEQVWAYKEFQGKRTEQE
jgi:hypothetical protein